MTTKKPAGLRVWCPTCGDVTSGHPEEDKILYQMLMNGFTTTYTTPTDTKKP